MVIKKRERGRSDAHCLGAKNCYQVHDGAAPFLNFFLSKYVTADGSGVVMCEIERFSLILSKKGFETKLNTFFPSFSQGKLNAF
jgi:hypothetical protein